MAQADHDPGDPTRADERREAGSALREREVREAFLLALSDKLRHAVDARGAMAAAAELFAEKIGVSVAHYLLVDADGDRFDVAGGYTDRRLPVTLEPSGRLSDYGPGWGPQFRAGEAVFFDDRDQRNAADAEGAGAHGIRSGSAVPLVRNGRLVAVFATADPAPRRWTAPERALQHEVAERTWAAVERARAEAALRESEERYRRLFESMDEACAVVEVLRDEAGAWADFRFVEVNPAFLTHTGMPYPVGRTATDLLGNPNPRWAQLYGQALDTGQPLRVVESEATLGRTFDLNVFSLDRARNRVAVLFTDITKRAHAQEALRQSSERLRLIVENARDYAIFTIDRDARITDWRGGAEAVFGYSRDEMIGRDADVLFTPEDNAAGEPERERARAARTGKAPNVRWHVCKDGRRVFIEGVCTALHDASGELVGYLKIGRDATERHEAEQRQQTLLAELQHRVRNILFVIRSVFSRTLEAGGTVEELAEHFQGRLDALARTQIVVTQSPRGLADLENLVREELLSVGVGDGPRVTIEGPEVELTGEAAESFGLVVHELTTNSIKYGALRFPEARLTIRWTANVNYGGAARLVFSWEEQGVPTMSVDPGREGFGTELITRALPYRLGAETRLELRPGGISCVIELPFPETGPQGGSD